MATETRSLPCELTNEEKRLRGESLARCRQEWEEAERARKAATQAAKATQERIDAEADLLADAIRTGKEYRDIEVREQRNDGTLSMDTYRVDTGEVIESRPLTASELQVGLFDLNAAKRKKRGTGSDGGDESGKN